MKKLLIIVISAILCVTTASAQTMLAETDNNQSFDQILDEYVEANTPAASYFEAVKDASYPTENDYQLNLEQLTNNPNQVAAGVLSILLGDFGVGHFYTGQTLRGVLDIVFCWTGIPAIIGLIEGIIWLCDSEEEWEERVARWNN